jgi:HK97 family phage portal protein
MSVFFRGLQMPTASQLIPSRASRRVGTVMVNADTAIRHSAVWACLRLRADLISTMPVDVYRNVGTVKVNVPTPPKLRNPGGERVDIMEWLYSTQVDLDQYGNCFGLITERDGAGLPSRIDLVPAAEATVQVRKGKLERYRFGGDTYEPEQVWHEKQHTRAGMHVGLSPIAAGAYAIGSYLSAQEFALDWFANSAVPSGHFKNTAQTLNDDQSDAIKERFKKSISTGEPLVTGSDWDYEMIGAKASEASFIETMKASLADICRYFSVPADMIDVESATGTITYANVTQRNLQLLIMNIGPTQTRREGALSTLVAQPRFVKLNSDAVVLRTDPLTRAQIGKELVNARLRAPSELREKDDMPPFTEEQFAEFDRLFARTPTPTAKTAEVQ